MRNRKNTDRNVNSFTVTNPANNAAAKNAAGSGLGVIAPWYEYQKQIKALFERDPQIIVGEVYEPQGGEVNYAFDIEVRSHEKFEALEKLLPATKEFGNVSLGIVLYDEENLIGVQDVVATYRALFRDNPIVQDIAVVPDQFGTPQLYILFKPEVIQYFRDELTDYNGLFSGLAQDIAKDVFADDTGCVHFCTARVGSAVAAGIAW